MTMDNRKRLHESCIKAIDHIRRRFEEEEKVSITFVEASRILADSYYWVDLGTLARIKTNQWRDVKKYA